MIAIIVILAAMRSVGAEPAGPAEPAGLTGFANGLRLLVLPEPQEPLVQVDIYVSLRGAGSAPGLAHLIEHLMFRSSAAAPGGSLRDSLLLNTTDIQGTTSLRGIHLRTRCLPGRLGRVLAVEAERVGRLHPDDTDLEHERNRILGEHDLRTEVYTAFALDLRIIAMAYGADATAGDPLLGNPEDIRALTMADVTAFLAMHLRPDRTVVLVRGPVDPPAVVDAVAATLGRIPPVTTDPGQRVLPPPAPGQLYVTRSDDEHDLLAVGFRLPYATPQDVAVVHLTETIMDRENGHPMLRIHENEALLTLHLQGSWSDDRSDSAAAAIALDQFWDETRKVVRRVGDDWLFGRNRAANVDDLRRRVAEPRRHADWRAQRLAADEDIIDAGVLAAAIDTLVPGQVRAFFAEQFGRERAFSAFSAGRAPKDDFGLDWSRNRRLEINPYLLREGHGAALAAADIEPVLAEARALRLAPVTRRTLANGVPLHVLSLTGEDEVFIGGVRTFPCLEDEAVGRNPGRLFLYRWLVNVGYSWAGSAIAPFGDAPGWNTSMDPNVSSMTITAHGPGRNLPDVVAAMHKRINVDKLNQYACSHGISESREWFARVRRFPAYRAWAWQLGMVFGADHPLAGWIQPDAESTARWSVDKANSLHRRVCQTGNLELVVVGDLTADEAAELFAGTFGRRGRAQAGGGPEFAPRDIGISGRVVDDPGSSVATIGVMFPVRPLAGPPALGPIDALVLEAAVEARLRAGLGGAGLTAASSRVFLNPLGANTVPLIHLVTQPADAAAALEVVRAVTEGLVSVPLSRDEDARARLRLLGPLLEQLRDARDARDLLLGYGLFGGIPDDPVGALCTLGGGELAVRAIELFPTGQHAWTVTADTTSIDLIPGFR